MVMIETNKVSRGIGKQGVVQDSSSKLYAKQRADLRRRRRPPPCLCKPMHAMAKPKMRSLQEDTRQSQQSAQITHDGQANWSYWTTHSTRLLVWSSVVVRLPFGHFDGSKFTGNHVEHARFRCRSGASTLCDEVSGLFILLEIGIVRRCERPVLGIQHQPATRSMPLACRPSCCSCGTNQRHVWRWRPILQHDSPISFVG